VIFRLKAEATLLLMTPRCRRQRIRSSDTRDRPSAWSSQSLPFTTSARSRSQPTAAH